MTYKNGETTPISMSVSRSFLNANLGQSTRNFYRYITNVVHMQQPLKNLTNIVPKPKQAPQMLSIVSKPKQAPKMLHKLPKILFKSGAVL